TLLGDFLTTVTSFLFQRATFTASSLRRQHGMSCREYITSRINICVRNICAFDALKVCLSASIFLSNMLAFKAGLAGVAWVYFNEQPTLPLLLVLKHINHHAPALI